MENEWILLNEYCKNSHIELNFLLRLEDEGLLETVLHNNKRYLHLSQLSNMEMFARLYYDLSVNIEGIDVIHNLLLEIKEMEKELKRLQDQVGTLSSPDEI